MGLAQGPWCGDEPRRAPARWRKPPAHRARVDVQPDVRAGPEVRSHRCAPVWAHPRQEEDRGLNPRSLKDWTGGAGLAARGARIQKLTDHGENTAVDKPANDNIPIVR